MTLDDILANLLSALEEEDIDSTEKYATQALEFVNLGGSLGRINREEFLFHMNGTLERVKAQRASDKKKSDLIDSIVNFKGD